MRSRCDVHLNASMEIQIPDEALHVEPSAGLHTIDTEVSQMRRNDPQLKRLRRLKSSTVNAHARRSGMQGSSYSINRCRVEAVQGAWPNPAMRHHPLLSRSFGMKANAITIAEVNKEINSSLWLSVAMIKILLRDAVDNLRRDQDNIRDQDSIAKEMDPDRIVKEMILRLKSAMALSGRGK